MIRAIYILFHKTDTAFMNSKNDDDKNVKNY